MKDQQVSGTHYAKLKIDPFTFAMNNHLDPMLFSVVKYVTRYKDKGTPLEDLKKARHIAEYRKQFPPNIAPKLSEDDEIKALNDYVNQNNLGIDVFLVIGEVLRANQTKDVYDFQRTMDEICRIIDLVLRVECNYP